MFMLRLAPASVFDTKFLPLQKYGYFLLKRVSQRGFWYMYEQSNARWWVCIIAISYVLFIINVLHMWSYCVCSLVYICFVSLYAKKMSINSISLASYFVFQLESTFFGLCNVHLRICNVVHCDCSL
jgi:hypothetical protein